MIYLGIKRQTNCLLQELYSSNKITHIGNEVSIEILPTTMKLLRESRMNLETESDAINILITCIQT
jgi:hypothetical protein